MLIDPRSTTTQHNMTCRNSCCGKGQGCGSGRGYNRNKRNRHQKQDQDKKETKFAPKVSGKVQRCMFETVKEHIPHKMQKDLEHGKHIATNLRKGIDTGISMEKPEREEAEKKAMTKE